MEREGGGCGGLGWEETKREGGEKMKEREKEGAREGEVGEGERMEGRGGGGGEEHLMEKEEC